MTTDATQGLDDRVTGAGVSASEERESAVLDAFEALLDWLASSKVPREVREELP